MHQPVRPAKAPDIRGPVEPCTEGPLEPSSRGPAIRSLTGLPSNQVPMGQSWAQPFAQGCPDRLCGCCVGPS